MSWQITGKEAGPLGLLDQYGGASAAYSLRNLSLYYFGPVVRVRRSSDNAEQDFTAAQVTDGTLTTFCGAGDGFVRTWYDQSGNGRHAQQPTAGSQPKVVDTGQLVLVNNQPSIDFNGTSSQLLQYYSMSRISLFAVVKADVNTAPDGLRFVSSQENTEPFSVNYLNYAIGTLPVAGGAGSVNHWNGSSWAQIANNSTITTNQQLLNFTRLAGSISVFSNGSDVTFSNNRTTSDAVKTSIGGPFVAAASSVGAFFDGKLQEFLVYSSDQSSSRTAIQNNINTHYSIY